MLPSLQRKTWNDLRAHGWQFLAVWLVLVMGTAFYGAMYPAGLNLVASVYNTYDQLNYMDFQIGLDPALASVVDDIRALPDVAAAEGRLVVESGLQLDPAQSRLLTLRLISLPDDGALTVNRSDLTSGHALQADDEILLLKRFAERHDIQVGDVLNLWINGQKRALRVAGLVFNPEYLVAGRSPEAPFPTVSSFGVAWMRYTPLAEALGASGFINDLTVRLTGDSQAATVSRYNQVRPILEDALQAQTGVAVRSRVQTASGGIIDANVNGNFPVLAAFSGMFLVGGMMVASVLLGRLVESERQRIGAMRALGVTRRELMLHYLAFGVFLGATGGLVGSALGYGTSFVMMYPFISAVAGGYLPGFVNAPQLPFIALGFGIVLVATTLAGAYPAWVQSATPPGIALRPPTPQSPSALSRIPLGGLPLSVRQALRNVLRVPGRALSTALGVMAAAIMVFTSFVILNSMDESFNVYFAAQKYDVRVQWAAPQLAETLEKQVKDVAGVESVQPALAGVARVSSPVRVSGPARADFDTLALALDEAQTFFDLKPLDGPPAFSGPNGVWIGHNLQRVLNVNAGDTVTIQIGSEKHDAQVLGVVSQVFGSPVFASRALMESYLPGNVFMANTALVRAAPGQLAAVQNALAELPGVVAVEDQNAFESDVRDYLQYWYQTGAMFAMFGYLLALAVILNTVNASLHEQQSELAVLRSLGVTRREIAQVVLLELVLMAGVGLALGVPLGRYAGGYLLGFFATDFYGLAIALTPAAYAVGVFSLLALVFLAAIPGLQAAYRSDLGMVSKGQGG
jgi:putative ABC transport system permease protein